MILRALFFVTLLCMTSAVPTSVLVVGFCVYAFLYTAYELIFLAVIIDGFYAVSGSGVAIPYYTISIILLLFVTEWLKPRLSVYNQ